jgi:5-formyltetrahydrofolate cyclo-ligase
MSETVSTEKASLRRRIKELRRQCSAEARASASAQLCQQLRGQPVWQGARQVLLFSPLPEEPDIRPLLQEALRDGKTVVLPRFEALGGKYVGCRIASLSELEPGHFGILEPRANCSLFALNGLDFLLVPGVAFDVSGHRLGRGKGYFDRLLAGAWGHKCGVAFDWQVVPRVPAGPHDVCMDSLLTPSRWVECGG